MGAAPSKRAGDGEGAGAPGSPARRQTRTTEQPTAQLLRAVAEPLVTSDVLADVPSPARLSGGPPMHPSMFAEEAEARVGEMSYAEKASLTSGDGFWSTTSIPRARVPAASLCDGPHGVRKEIDSSSPGFSPSLPATCFPTAAGLAASWDIELLRSVGEALGDECVDQNVSVLLGPGDEIRRDNSPRSSVVVCAEWRARGAGVNLKRTPLCGRNFEYFSEAFVTAP